jgi:hypothetical protein
MMAIKSDSKEGSGGKGDVPISSSNTTVSTGNTPTPALSDRGGGPKSRQGKRRSSRNAVKHGVYSKLPLIGDEREEDRIEIVKGMLDSFEPGNWNEQSTVEQMAQNRCQRHRAERWMHEKLRLQQQSVDHWNRQSMDPAMMDLPEDEKAWWYSDPSAALQAARRLGDPPDGVLGMDEVASYLTAFKRSTRVEHPRGWIPAVDDTGYLDLDLEVVSIAQVLEGVDLAAKAAGFTRNKMLAIIEMEIKSAVLHRAMRRNDDHHRREIGLVDALALSESDFAYYERWVTLLDKEYDRLFKRLEVSQRARKGQLPPPVRLHHSED